MSRKHHQDDISEEESGTVKGERKNQNGWKWKSNKPEMTIVPGEPSEACENLKFLLLMPSKRALILRYF